MKRINALLTLIVALSSGCVTTDRPRDAELQAYKVYQHAIYLKATAAKAGGSNKLLNTTKLSTEGKDPIVTPTLDYLYSEVVIDLSSGPVEVELPRVDPADRYFSIHVMDQENHTIYDEIQPSGMYVFLRQGAGMAVPDTEKKWKAIPCPGDYPYLLVCVQVKNEADRPNCIAIQNAIEITGVSKSLEFDNPIQFTIDTHDISPLNEGLLASFVNYDEEDYEKCADFVIKTAPTIRNNMGAFGTIRRPGAEQQ